MNKEVDEVYNIQKKERSLSSSTSEVTSSDFKELIKYIQRLETTVKQNYIRITRSVYYTIDTSISTRYKIDIKKDFGTEAIELVVLDTGGGFSYEINEDRVLITASRYMVIEKEPLSSLYITGSGSNGIAKIKVSV